MDYRLKMDKIMIIRLLTPVIAMAVLGLIFGVGLAYTLKIFGIELDPNLHKILSLLPGVNCGACGKAGCAAFAEALSKGEDSPSGCTVSSEERRRSISKILGIDYKDKIKTIAASLCNGGTNARDKYAYEGIKTCKAATLLFDGYKDCAFGCLGFGDCVDACPFGAIKITGQNIPEVNPAKCTACGKCLNACPKNLFTLIPEKNHYYVKCSSKDSGSIVAKVCKSGCITCLKCEKACPETAVKVEYNLSKINYERCKNIGKCLEVCPTKVIIKRG